MSDITLGGIPVHEAGNVERRIAMVLWGASACGKTTYACTAPGKKLLMQFDPNGSDSVAYRDDVLVMDMAGQPNTVVEHFKRDDPFGLSKFLKDHPEVQTVVLDSITMLANIATENAVDRVKSATIENPGLKGYGHRNAITLRAVTSLLRTTARHGRHLIIIAHEGEPEKSEEGVVLYITMTLSAKMSNSLGLQLSEIWHMTDTGKDRRILVRPARNLKPMKTRLFDASSSPEMKVTYDANTDEGETIESIYQRWIEGGYKKLPIPA